MAGSGQILDVFDDKTEWIYQQIKYGMGEKEELRVILRFGAWAIGRMEFPFTEEKVLGEQAWKVKPGIWF